MLCKFAINRKRERSLQSRLRILQTVDKVWWWRNSNCISVRKCIRNLNLCSKRLLGIERHLHISRLNNAPVSGAAFPTWPGYVWALIVDLGRSFGYRETSQIQTVFFSPLLKEDGWRCRRNTNIKRQDAMALPKDEPVKRLLSARSSCVGWGEWWILEPY